ncbi:MAG: glycosyltransferase [Gracilimonas sp.]|nr:glycosyltransferase [Gracilimonas sp.]
MIITYYWPPSGGAGVQRWVKFCKYLPEFNIETIVLTVKNGTYPIIDESLLDEISENLQIFYSKSIEPYSIFAKLTGKTDKQVSTPTTAFSMDGGLMQKLGVWLRSNFFIPDARIGWIPSTFLKAKKIIKEQNIDVVVTTGPPNSTHIIGTKLKKWYPGLKWVMDMRDPWSQIFYNETLPRTSLAQNIDKSLEKKALKAADEVIVVSQSMVKLQQSIYEREYHVISNGFDHDDFPDHPKTNKEQKLTIKYIGSMTEPAIPYNFFSALSALDPNLRSKISVHFFGSYNQKVHDVIDEYNLSELVSFKGYVPHLQAKNEMSSADLLLLVIPRSKHNQLILTGKLFDYIAAQRPILYIGPEDGDAAAIIDKYKLGICFDYQEINPIQEFLRDAISKNNIPYQKWETDFKNHPFSRYRLTEKLVKLIE